MSPLQKVDVVMFWSSRLIIAFLTLFVGWCTLRVIDEVTESYVLMHHWHPLLTMTILTQATTLVVLALLNSAFFFPRRWPSRAFFFLLGTWFFLSGGLGTIANAISEPELGWKIGACAVAASFAAMIWIAARPPALRLSNLARRQTA
jgi:hypothetical protein